MALPQIWRKGKGLGLKVKRKTIVLLSSFCIKLISQLSLLKTR